LPHTGYLWRPQTFAEVTPNAFTLFRLLRPKLDVLIVGGGRSTPHLTEENYRQVSSICKAFELLKTVREAFLGLFSAHLCFTLK
jgi:hypothetical protein